ncbi:hypothetical protein [Cyanobium sp. Morenito 9A2]|uniref:hypothetical protein n=1 Tax=Cyanobium sp. Morenito 9A2 TaxID=2823718 RepID=UPI0020CCBA99|nr:hypothetical protein [Cyanobium sp. Morenito 9A2]MCP9850035.1 hypothetical protein [Cyanobium sp. Morenito 9A2]
MAQARVAPTRVARPGNPWIGPLVIGLCFSLGFGLTQRLLALSETPSLDLGHRFDTQPFPGTSLESLRMRYGSANESLRGDPNPPAKPTPTEGLPGPLPGADPASGAADALAPSGAVPSDPAPGEPAPVKSKVPPANGAEGEVAPQPSSETPEAPPLPEAVAPAR